jgi:hypothetical protein
MLFTFIAAITQPKNQTDNWQNWLNQALKETGLSLVGEEKLLYEKDLIGFYRCIELNEGITLFRSAPWFPFTQQECPWLHELAGFFNWTHVAGQSIAEDQLLPKLIQIQSILIARSDNQNFKRPVSLVEFSLSNLLSKHGFHDGDAFLSRDENYLLYVYDELTRCLEVAGLKGHIAILETVHNPILLSEGLFQNGKPVKDEFLTLANLFVHIWAYDWDILTDTEFWQE